MQVKFSQRLCGRACNKSRPDLATVCAAVGARKEVSKWWILHDSLQSHHKAPGSGLSLLAPVGINLRKPDAIEMFPVYCVGNSAKCKLPATMRQ